MKDFESLADGERFFILRTSLCTNLVLSLTHPGILAFFAASDGIVGGKVVSQTRLTDRREPHLAVCARSAMRRSAVFLRLPSDDGECAFRDV